MAWRENSDQGIITTPAVGTYHTLVGPPAVAKRKLVFGLILTSPATGGGTGAVQAYLIKKKGSTRVVIDRVISFHSTMDYAMLTIFRQVLKAEDEELEIEIVANPNPADVHWAVQWADID